MLGERKTLAQPEEEPVKQEAAQVDEHTLCFLALFSLLYKAVIAIKELRETKYIFPLCHTVSKFRVFYQFMFPNSI